MNIFQPAYVFVALTWASIGSHAASSASNACDELDPDCSDYIYQCGDEATVCGGDPVPIEEGCEGKLLTICDLDRNLELHDLTEHTLNDLNEWVTESPGAWDDEDDTNMMEWETLEPSIEAESEEVDWEGWETIAPGDDDSVADECAAVLQEAGPGCTRAYKCAGEEALCDDVPNDLSCEDITICVHSDQYNLV